MPPRQYCLHLVLSICHPHNPRYVLILSFTAFSIFKFILLYRVQQKYLTILQHSCDWKRWRGEFVLERPSSEAQSISVAMECWSVEYRAFAVETYF